MLHCLNSFRFDLIAKMCNYTKKELKDLQTGGREQQVRYLNKNILQYLSVTDYHIS